MLLAEIVRRGEKGGDFSFSRTLGGKAACFGSKDPTPPAFANQDRGSAVLAAPIGHAVTFMSAADPTFNTTPPNRRAGREWLAI
jgi:hypothetical protein